MADDTTTNNVDNDMDLFRAKLMKDLKLDDLSPEQKAEYEDKIDRLVDNRIKNLMLIYLAPEKVEELAKLWDADDHEGVQKLLIENVPDWNDKVLEELLSIQQELIAKMSADAKPITE